jgi:hypothetical protein
MISPSVNRLLVRRIIVGLLDDRDQSVVIDQERGWTMAHYRVHAMAVPLPPGWRYWGLFTKDKERLSVLHVAAPKHVESADVPLPWGFLDGHGRTAALAQALKGYRPRLKDTVDPNPWIDRGRCGQSALDHYFAAHDDVSVMIIRLACEKLQSQQKENGKAIDLMNL